MVQYLAIMYERGKLPLVLAANRILSGPAVKLSSFCGGVSVMAPFVLWLRPP